MPQTLNNIFFFPILQCSQFGNDPQFNLANFDHQQGRVRKQQIKGNSSVF
jgi:hypothetical protein